MLIVTVYPEERKDMDKETVARYAPVWKMRSIDSSAHCLLVAIEQGRLTPNGEPS